MGQERVLYDVASAAAAFGDSAVARATGLTRAAVAGLRSGVEVKTRRSLSKIETGLRALSDASDRMAQKAQADEERLRLAVAKHHGVRAAARALGLDPSNLAKRLKERSPPVLPSG